ncbi:DUF2946 family protein [Parazoarcus communis]|uniref:DUF2946 domain-containing protein n=1 Tax=Parazoarcus communis SWub3 = DSM 12120 TaxID=1121029 RepID=A0A323URF2_9RHOO|nr:DUF2946 family protein [Parazoarcus communis]NMG72458.1 DUF2946 family protein [Parazoarcus communis SWub3 = DSM 12120]PZA15602.1 DUF2946 domain-containing protein [Azoarcus communis] [Parazoarcus communis SWub3 = DSM 12120]
MTQTAPLAQTAWPDVPDCHGWLSLDRRGGWRLKGELVRHEGLIRFINANYGPDGCGRWRVQNGPQQVFVDLEYTPWVWRLGEGGDLLAHTGQAAGPVEAVWVDDEGSVLLLAGPGIGVLDDRDLAAFLDECVGADGAPADEALFACLMEGKTAAAYWRGCPLEAATRAALVARFGL